MEAHRFDTVVKALGNDTTRRRVLGALLGGVASGAVFAHANETIARRLIDCPEGQRRCGRNNCYIPGEQNCCHCPHGVGFARPGSCQDFECPPEV
jgi:hypothetical protein